MNAKGESVYVMTSSKRGYLLVESGMYEMTHRHLHASPFFVVKAHEKYRRERVHYHFINVDLMLSQRHICWFSIKVAYLYPFVFNTSNEHFSKKNYVRFMIFGLLIEMTFIFFINIVVFSLYVDLL